MRAIRQVVLAAIVVSVCMADAWAQSTYRWVDPKTGSTVISDKPPPPGVKKVDKANWSSSDNDNAPLPYALRQLSEKFPVILYVRSGCPAYCKQARALLNERGVPFTEKVIASEEELGELGKQLGGELQLPSIRVGRQSSSGFAADTWNSLLDAAGYPVKAPYGVKRPPTGNE
ncbi:MAG TPA: glutaredoxin domain-containing protein [Accumulibacter sp.]|jgi:glutaredoxin|nr:glutaredoxin domain-containing protein [Accumulibacter sp.]HPP46303.1 glutaredoxin domain-containing protein [Accumulibacter sp.]